MHELSVCQSLLVQVKQIAMHHHARRVTGITLQLGPLSGIEPGLLQQAFTQLRVGSVAQDARLVIECKAVRVRCQTCQQESDVTPNHLVCVHCGDYHTRVISGDEMLLASVELDVDAKLPAQAVASGGSHV